MHLNGKEHLIWDQERMSDLQPPCSPRPVAEAPVKSGLGGDLNLVFEMVKAFLFPL